MNPPKLKPPLPRRGRIHTIDGRLRHFQIEDEIFCNQPLTDKGTKKRVCFQKIRFEDTKALEYRLTYYMLGVKPGAKGRWVFGQYSLLVPAKQLSFLLREARKRKRSEEHTSELQS